MSYPIINIRGTSGSGKSTLVRRIRDLYQNVEPVHVEGRKQPLYYRLTGSEQLPDAFLLGHYETACGGCDTIPSMDKIFDLVYEKAQEGAVLFEGLLVSAEYKRTARLFEELSCDLHVVHLDVPIETCVESINMRRREKKPDAPPVNPKNTESKWKGTRSTCKRLGDIGIEVFSSSDRDECFRAVVEMLR